MEKDGMEKEKNIIHMEYQNLKENILMEKEVEKGENIIQMEYQNLKENISLVKDGMEKGKNIMMKIY